MLRNVAQQWRNKLKKKPKGLRSPRRTKRLLRWAKTNRSQAAYVSALTWPTALSALVPSWVLAYGKMPPSVGPWLFYTSTSLAVIYAWMLVADRIMVGRRAWRRRLDQR
jgi:hypothetical protein